MKEMEAYWKEQEIEVKKMNKRNLEVLRNKVKELEEMSKDFPPPKMPKYTTYPASSGCQAADHDN